MSNPGPGALVLACAATTPTPLCSGGMVRGGALKFLGGTCGLLGESCGRPELPWGDAGDALEVIGELALVGEASVRRDLRQGELCSFLQELPGPLDPAGDDVLVRRQPG